MEKKVENILELIETEEIIEAMVIMIEENKELETNIAVIDLDGIKGVIKEEDLDYEVKWRSLVPFVGKKVFVVVTEYDEETNTAFCSRAIAQERMRDGVIERLETEEEVDAVMTGSTNYGAYLEVDGIYCMLKNADFGDDHVPVRDVHEVGDVIKVKLLRVGDKSNRITVEAVNKHVVERAANIIDFEENQVVVGEVNGVKPWGVFVTIAPGFDALCSVPPTIEMEEGLSVAMKITQVQEDSNRIRGKILKSLQ